MAGPPRCLSLPQCEIVDEETGQQQAVVGVGEGKMEAVIIILLAGSSEPEAARCHLALHPPFLLFVRTPFLPLLVSSYVVLSIQPVFFLSSTTSRVSFVVYLCLRGSLVNSQVYLYVRYLPATRYLNCHLSLLRQL